MSEFEPFLMKIKLAAGNHRINNAIFVLMVYLIIIEAILLLVLVFLALSNYKLRKRLDSVNNIVSSFIAIVHEMKTNVSLIRAPLGELEDEENLSEKSKNHIKTAVENVDSLSHTISQLIDLQRAELSFSTGLHPIPYSVPDFLKEKVEEFRLRAIQKGIEISCEAPSDMPKVSIDRKLMDKIVNNVIVNAIEHTSSGYVRLVASWNKDKWTLEIKDTGEGIPKEYQKYVFHRYFVADKGVSRFIGSSGVGLIITKTLVDQHKGIITFHSEEGKGSTFRMQFPIVIESHDHSEEPSVAEKTSVLPSEVDTTKNVILLADDDDKLRKYLSESLSMDYTVIESDNGTDALKRAGLENPDIIISDVIMPGIDGIELCRTLKSSLEASHIPIILMSALNAKEDIITGLESGAADYITKPFDLSVLKVRIRNILQERQNLRNSVLETDRQEDDIDYASQLDKEFMDEVMKIIEEEMNNSELSINDFCRKLGMSRTSAYNKIKSLTGHGPNDFIQIVRLNKSMELLKTRKYNINEVSDMVGFSSPKYFSTCFKKQFGVSPSKI